MPSDVACAVAAFLRARLSDAERWGGASLKGSADWRDEMALVREWDQARGLHHWVTADCLASTMLSTATRYRTHRGYDPAWDAWQPFGDLRPPRQS